MIVIRSTELHHHTLVVKKVLASMQRLPVCICCVDWQRFYEKVCCLQMHKGHSNTKDFVCVYCLVTAASTKDLPLIQYINPIVFDPIHIPAWH